MVNKNLEAFRPVNELLIWIDDWGVWPSGQHIPLFTRLREALGVREELIEKCGHLVGSDEFEDAISIALLSVLFLWDCYVLPSSGRDFLFYSHDEIGFQRTNQDGTHKTVVATTDNVASSLRSERPISAVPHFKR